MPVIPITVLSAREIRHSVPQKLLSKVLQSSLLFREQERRRTSTHSSFISNTPSNITLEIRTSHQRFSSPSLWFETSRGRIQNDLECLVLIPQV